jgi:rubrerythrin
MKRSPIDAKYVHELLLQALETERGGIKIYMAAVKAAVNDGLQKEWSKYLEETRIHEELVLALLQKLKLDPDMQSPDRSVVARRGAALLKAIEMAVANGDPEAAQLVATECVTLAETKDHFNWI